MAKPKEAAGTIQGTSKSSPVGGRFSDLKPTFEAANDGYTPRIDEDRGKSRKSADDDDDDDDEAIGGKGSGRKGEEAGWKSKSVVGEEAGWKSKSVGGWNKGTSNGTKAWAATGGMRAPLECKGVDDDDDDDDEAIGSKCTGWKEEADGRV